MGPRQGQVQALKSYHPDQWTWQGAFTSELLQMIARHGNGDPYQLIDYREWACAALSGFMQHALRVLSRYPFKGDLIAHVMTIRPEERFTGWAADFPRENPQSHMNLIHYLTTGDGMCPLVVFEGMNENTKGHLVTPAVGLSVVFARQLYGVMVNSGSTPQVALSIQAIPARSESAPQQWQK